MADVIPIPAAEADEIMQAVALAQRFHEAYERLAPKFGYKTRLASAVPWDEVPASNRHLMTAVCAEVLRQQPSPELRFHNQRVTAHTSAPASSSTSPSAATPATGEPVDGKPGPEDDGQPHDGDTEALPDGAADEGHAEGDCDTGKDGTGEHGA